MKLSYIIALCNLGFAVLLTVFFMAVGLMDGGIEGSLFIFGAVCSVGGVADLLICGILFLAKSKEWGKGFLLSAGLFLLIGAGICGPMLMR